MTDTSIHGEARILSRWLSEIGETNRHAVEFGALDGEQWCNTRHLRERGWTCHWWDKKPRHPDVCLENIGKDIDDVFARHLVPIDVDVCVIDIDGNDYWVWEALTISRPRVLMIEYNPHFSLDESVAMRYEPDYNYDSTIKFGASFSAMRALGEAKGYQLVEEIKYSNLIFIPDEIEVESRLVVPTLPKPKNQRPRRPEFFVDV